MQSVASFMLYKVLYHHESYNVRHCLDAIYKTYDAV